MVEMSKGKAAKAQSKIAKKMSKNDDKAVKAKVAKAVPGGLVKVKVKVKVKPEKK
jgi:hypothetical protein